MNESHFVVAVSPSLRLSVVEFACCALHGSLHVLRASSHIFCVWGTDLFRTPPPPPHPPPLPPPPLSDRSSLAALETRGVKLILT